MPTVEPGGRLSQIWPLFGLRLRVADLELRWPSEDELVALADLAAAGVHPPHLMPFQVPWTRAQPPRLQRAFLQHHWGCARPGGPTTTCR